MSDILFQNHDVCILDPSSSRGVLIFTISSSAKVICSEGLYSYNTLRHIKPELNLKNRHHEDPEHDNLIFFRAPFHPNVSSFETSYKVKSPADLLPSRGALAIIRIDPDKTFVYSSEIRAKGTYADLQTSRILFNSYITRIENNLLHIGTHKPGHKVCANLITYYTDYVPLSYKCIYPKIEYLPIERMAEVVVKIPHIPPSWFVACYTGSSPNIPVKTLKIIESVNSKIGSVKGALRTNSVPEDVNRILREIEQGVKAVEKAANNSSENGTFIPIHLTNKYGDNVIQCPICKEISGSTLILNHVFNCPNKNKRPNM